MKYEITNKSEPNQHVITLSGAITPFEDEGISAKLVKKELDKINDNKDLLIKLSSPGGDAFEGIEIYNLLDNLPNKITIEVTSLVASAGSIIAMASDKLLMHTGSTMMIHEASTGAFGTKSDIYKTLELLKKIDNSLVDIYAKRTGLNQDEIHNLMKQETWFTVDEAIKLGFADGKVTSKNKNKGGTQNNMDSEKVLKQIVNIIQKEQFSKNILNDYEEDDNDTYEDDDNKNYEEKLEQIEIILSDIVKRLEKLEENNTDENNDNDNEDNNEEETENKINNRFFYL